MRARMAISYSGTQCELREVVLKNKPESMLKVSPKGTVPVVIDDDHVIDESIEVMAWALAKADPDGWLSQSLGHPLIQRNDQEFKACLDHYKYFDRFPEQPQSHYFSKGLEFLNELEVRLNADANGQYFLETPKLSVLDVAIFPFIRQFAMVDKSKFDVQDLPKLQAWLESLLSSKLFSNVMKKYPAWQLDQQERILFGT
jgi:glutathione S-transferase